jgi:hypothetical protein
MLKTTGAATATAAVGAAKTHHGNPAQDHHDAGPKIRLNEDQHSRHAEQRERGPDRAPFASLGHRDEFVEAGECEDDRRLHEFGRLKFDRTELEPALCTLADESETLDSDQHDERYAVKREGDRLDRRFLHPRHADGDAEEEDEHDALLDRPRLQ